MSEPSKPKLRGNWLFVTPWGEPRAYRTLAALKQAVAAEPDDELDDEDSPESEPAPLSLSGAVIEEILAPPRAAPRPAQGGGATPATTGGAAPRPAVVPAQAPPADPPMIFPLAPVVIQPSARPLPFAGPSHDPAPKAAPPVRTMAPPLPAQPFALSQSMRPPVLVPDAPRTAPRLELAGGSEFPEAEPRRAEVGSVPSDAMVYGTLVGPPPSRRMLAGAAVLLTLAGAGVAYALFPRSPSEKTQALAVTVAPSNIEAPVAPLAPQPSVLTTLSVAPSLPPEPSAAQPQAEPPAPTVPRAPVVAVAPPVPTGDTLPTDPGVLLQLGVNAQHAGDFAKAQKIYRALVAKNPGDVDGLSGLGDSARGLGNTGEAIANYRRALAVSPAFYPALLGLADALWDRGDHAEASKHYAEIVARFPMRNLPPRVRERSSS